MSVTGITQTKAFLDGINAFALEVISLTKDGIQAKDAIQLVEDIIMNAALKAKLTAMVDALKSIGPEIKDVDLSEGVQLVQFEYDGVKAIIEALKK